MRNLETPVLKFAIYGAHSNLGSALLCELMARQHEVVAILEDLNSLAARPGLRTKVGNLYDPARIGESVAGMDGVVCLYGSRDLPGEVGFDGIGQAHDFYQAVEALLVGMPRVQVQRLLLVADFARLENCPEVAAALQRLALNPLDWTLVGAPEFGEGLAIEELAAPKDETAVALRRLAAGIADELEQQRHRHERMNLVL